MKIAVFGATGGTGRWFIRLALKDGHQVTALVRNPAKLGADATGVDVIRGDAFDGDAVRRVVQGPDAVFNSLGMRPWKPAPVCAVGTGHILSAMKECGVKRIVCVSSLGVGDSRDQLGWLLRPLYSTVIRRALADKEEMERMVKASDREWVIVQPSVLTNGRLRGDCKVSTDGAIRSGFISRAVVARFCLRQFTDNLYLKQSPVITG